MADFSQAYSISDKVRQIQSKISTSNTLNGFIDNKYLAMMKNLNFSNKDDQNILKMLSDILVSLVGSQDKLKKMLVEILTNNLPTIETKIKDKLKQFTLQLCSCGIDARLNVPNGVIDQAQPMPLQYPYVDQYDFYGLFGKDINDPLQKLQFDKNFNTFVKNKINAQSPSFTWKNKDNADVMTFTYIEPEDRIKIGPPNDDPNIWGPSGMGLKQFVDLYVDSINLFPPESVLKDLLDAIFNMKEGDPFQFDFDFLAKLLLGKCNCKTIEDDRSKSTFDLTYNDFVQPKPEQPIITTDIKFGPVDAPVPLSIIPQQPNLDGAYLSTVSVLTKDEFIKGNRNAKEQQIKNVIDTTLQNKHDQTNGINLPFDTKFSLKPNLEADANLKMILMLPVILTMPIFSPKISMYFGVIYKRYYITEPNRELWKDKDEYYIFIGKLIELVIKELLQYLLKLLYAKIKKEVIALVKKIIAKVLGEKIMGYIAQIKSIIDLYNQLKGRIPPQLPNISFGNCKSILDNLLKLFNIPNIPPGLPLPPGASMMGMMKSGLSSTQMTQDAVKYMNQFGLNTNPMPNGTPNPNVIIANAMSSAVIQNIQSNARGQISGIIAPNGMVEGGCTIT